MGYQNAFLVAAFVSLAQIAFFFVFIKYGRGMRKASAQRYLKYVAEVKDGGFAH